MSSRNQFSLRMSTHRLGKSSITKPTKRSRIKPPKLNIHQTDKFLRDGGIAGFKRRSRQYEAIKFRLCYTIPDSLNIKERKTYICSSGTSSSMYNSSGFTWVAVHGMESICVVVSKKALDVARLSGVSRYETSPGVSRDFAATLISEIEDLADSSIESSQTFDLPVQKPFAIVSVMPKTTNVLEDSNHEISTAVSNENAAVKYLQEKIRGGSVFTRTETTQAAIYAFQHVVGQNLKTSDIRVAVLEYNEISHLDVLEKEKLLAATNYSESGGGSGSIGLTDIKEPGSGGSVSSGSSSTHLTITNESDVE